MGGRLICSLCFDLLLDIRLTLRLLSFSVSVFPCVFLMLLGVRLIRVLFSVGFVCCFIDCLMFV